METNIYRFLECSDDGRTILKCDTSYTGDLFLPEGIERIADFAFKWCDGLESITFPKSLVSIGEHAFAGCEYLKKLSFEKGLKIIENFCFGDCHSLSEVVLPVCLEEIADYAFCHCSSLKTIVLPASLKRIGNGAFFYCTNLQSIRLPKSIKQIEDYAFQGCRSIINISLPDSTKTIGKNAFEGCFRLKKITMPRGITSIGDRAFGCCSSLEEITIPQTVKNLGDGVFDGCRELKSIWFMGVVEHIGETSQWLENSSYSDEDDEYYYGYELEFHLEEECFDYEQKEFQRECYYNETLAEWLQRQNNLKIHVPDGYEWYYFMSLNKESNKILGESSRPAFYRIMSIMDQSSMFAQNNSVPFIAFCKAFGTPAVREYKSLGFTALICKDADGEETFINPPKSGNALTLVDFSKSPTEIVQQLADNAENLVVLQDTKESDGSQFYTLVDKENYVINGFIKPDYYEEGTSYERQIKKLLIKNFGSLAKPCVEKLV